MTTAGRPGEQYFRGDIPRPSRRSVATDTRSSGSSSSAPWRSSTRSPFSWRRISFDRLPGEDGLPQLDEYVETRTFRERPILCYFGPTDRAAGMAAWTGGSAWRSVSPSRTGCPSRGRSRRDASPGVDAGAFPLVRQRRADILRIRMGVDAARNRSSGELARGRRERPARVDRVAAQWVRSRICSVPVSFNLGGTSAGAT